MSRSRLFPWSDSALLFAVKARDEGMPIKRIAAYVGKGVPAVIEALRRYDAGNPPPESPEPAQIPPHSCG